MTGWSRGEVVGSSETEVQIRMLQGSIELLGVMERAANMGPRAESDAPRDSSTEESDWSRGRLRDCEGVIIEDGHGAGWGRRPNYLKQVDRCKELVVETLG